MTTATFDPNTTGDDRTDSAVTTHVLVVGDEILTGQCADENSPYLIRRLTDLGHRVGSVTVLPDDPTVIASRIRELVHQDTDATIITTGGIGPTPDDVTYEGIAAGIGQPLVTHLGMLSFVTGWATGLPTDPHVQEAMQRLAEVPNGARLLPGVDGPAPAVVVDAPGLGDARVTIVMLPGSPGYVHDLMEEHVIPFVLTCGRTAAATVVLEHTLPEALLGPVFDLAAARHARVSLGSYVGPPRRLVLRGPRHEVATAAHDVDLALRGMSERWRLVPAVAAVGE